MGGGGRRYIEVRCLAIYTKYLQSTPLVNCNENIEQNIICYQIYDTVIGLNKILGILLVRSRFGAAVRQH